MQGKLSIKGKTNNPDDLPPFTAENRWRKLQNFTTVNKIHISILLCGILVFLSPDIKAVGGSSCTTATALTFNGCLAIEASQTWNPSADGVSPVPCAVTGTRDSWYKFTATATTNYFMYYTSFDGVLAVYSGACGGLTQMFCSDIAGTGGTEYKTQAGFIIGNTYFVQILPYSGAGFGTYSVGIADDPYCWTGWNGAVITTASNYANYTSSPGVDTSVKVPANAFNAFAITSNSNYDIGSLTVQTGANVSIAIASQTALRTIDIDNLTLESSATFVVNHSHATFGLNLDVQDFTANSSSALSISNCNNNFNFTARDINIIANANITFPNLGSTKKYQLTSSGNTTIAASGELTIQDYVTFIAGNVTVNGAMRFDAQNGDNPVINGNLTVNGILNHQGHRYLYLDGAGKTISGTGNFYGGTICPLAIRGSYTFGALTDNTIRLSHLAILGTGTASIGSNTVNTCFFLQDASATFNQNSGVLGIAGPTSLTMPSNGAKYAGFTWENWGVFTANPSIANSQFNEGTGTTYFNSGDFTNADIYYVNDQTVPSVTYNNLKIRTNNTKIVTLGTGSAFNASGNFSIYNPGTPGGVATTNGALSVGSNIYLGALSGVNPSGNALTLNCGQRIFRSIAGGAITMGNNVDHAINISYLDGAGGDDECFTGFGTPTFYGTVSYNGNGNQEIIPATFYNIALAGTSGTKTALGNNSVTNTWTNNRATAGFSGSTFKVSFNGANNQNITGSYGTTFNKLEVNNSNNVNILKAATVSSSVDFTQGDFIAATSTEPLIFDVAASISTLASDDSHVNGYVAKNTNTTSEFIFPCGDGSLYRLCGVTPSSVSARTYRVKYFSTGYGDYSITGTMLDHVTTHEWWDIAATSGATKNAQIRLSWGSNSGLNNNYVELVNAHYNGSDWEFVPLTYSYTGNAASGTILCNENTWSTFSPFTLASTTTRNLPVELLDFSATCTANGIEFIWSTATETNNDYFTIEKSSDMIIWSQVANIGGAGNSNFLLSYSYIYDQTSNTSSYYRLKQTDYDGKFEIFSPISVICNELPENLIIFYNNETSNLTINFGGSENGTGQLQIINTIGQIIYSDKIIIDDNQNISNLPKLSAGYYFVKIWTEGQNYKPKKILISGNN